MPVMLELDGCIIEHGDCYSAEREDNTKASENQELHVKSRLTILFEKLNIKHNK